MGISSPDLPATVQPQPRSNPVLHFSPREGSPCSECQAQPASSRKLGREDPSLRPHLHSMAGAGPGDPQGCTSSEHCPAPWRARNPRTRHLSPGPVFPGWALNPQGGWDRRALNKPGQQPEVPAQQVQDERKRSDLRWEWVPSPVA